MPEPARPAELYTSQTEDSWHVTTLVASLSALRALTNHLVARGALEHLVALSHAFGTLVKHILILKEG